MLVRPSDVHRGEQIWVAGIREQPSDRLPTEVADRDPQVEQGRAGGDVQGPAVRILVRKPPPDGGVDVRGRHSVSRREAPGLRVVHGAATAAAISFSNADESRYVPDMRASSRTRRAAGLAMLSLLPSAAGRRGRPAPT